MVQARGRASLAVKAELQFGIPLDVLRHGFYGDVTVQNLVVGLVHRPHGPFAELFDNGVFPESRYHQVFFTCDSNSSCIQERSCAPLTGACARTKAGKELLAEETLICRCSTEYHPVVIVLAAIS